MQNIFGFIIHPMELGVIWLAVTVGTAGIGIILFTIIVRLVLSPLNIVQLRSAKSMQRLQPKLAELKQKHGKDREALTAATMALYREHNVNPAMGCLPTLLQFPILIGLFYALLHLGQSPTPDPRHHGLIDCNGHFGNFASWLQGCYAISDATGSVQHIFHLFHAHFLWLSNGLGQPDPLYILPILAGVTQWVQSRMMLTRSQDPQQQMMNTMMNFMPLMIVFFATRYASGLSLYWVTSTLIGILIQYRITGLGLLPSTLRSIGARLTDFSGAAAAVQSQDSTRSKGAGTSRPRKTLAVVADPSVDGKVEPNGHNGAGRLSATTENGTAPSGTTHIARPRKKANRAKGGRGGGRRG